MEIYTAITALRERFPRIAVALGTFDGVHLGHQKIIRRAVELARENQGASMVFTFSNHPLSVVAPQDCPVQIIPNEHKYGAIRDLGVDILVSIPFTREFLQRSPEGFLALLHENYQPQFIVVGPNYSFGHRGTGNPRLLKQAEERYGYAAEVLPAVYLEEQLVSSTAIRQYIAAGDMENATRMLGRSLLFDGEVIQGSRRGRGLGFPTANLAINPGFAIPADGVYVARVHWQGQSFAAVVNIGDNPTFHDAERHLEAFLLDFSGDLYGQRLSLELLHRLRGEIAFASADALREQIERDVVEAKKYLLL